MTLPLTAQTGEPVAPPGLPVSAHFSLGLILWAITVWLLPACGNAREVGGFARHESTELRDQLRLRGGSMLCQVRVR